MVASILGALIGLAAGYCVSLFIAPGLLQTLVAVLVGVLLGGGIAWMMLLRFREVGPGFFGFGVENVLWLTAVVIVASVIHVAVTAVAPRWPWMDAHRALVLGAAAGAYAGASVARAVNILVELNAR